MIKQLIAAAALAGAAAVSHAAEPASTPFYAGVDAGATKVTGGADGSHGSYGVFAGYNLNANFAVEAGFRRLYTWNAFSEQERTNQSSLSLIGSLPLTPSLSLYGRLGVNQLDIHKSWTGTLQATPGTFSYTDHTTSALFGLGAGYKLTDQVSARFEVQRPHEGLTNYSAGVSYAF